MNRYDPECAPDSVEWLALDEGERIYLVEQFHEAARVEVPDIHLHALFHVVVENQLVLPGQELVRETFQRLMREGLSRHDAVHAIGAVLVGRVHGLLQSGTSAADSEKEYQAQLKRLSAKRWRSGDALR